MQKSFLSPDTLVFLVIANISEQTPTKLRPNAAAGAFPGAYLPWWSGAALRGLPVGPEREMKALFQPEDPVLLGMFPKLLLMRPFDFGGTAEVNGDLPARIKA